MNAITETKAQPKSILFAMANRYEMEPKAFEATVRATCMRPDKNGREPNPAEFAAFLLVAKEYSLNPLTKEIYAFSAKGGGIVPIVSIDGWINLVNSHPQCDGFDIEFHDDNKGNPISCTCKMYRKDRGRPVVVTEYLSECIRNTDPWKMKHRMLRHKAVIQAARYAFGFSGIYDEDEGEKIAEMRDITPPEPPAPPTEDEAPQPPESEITEAEIVQDTPPETEPEKEVDVIDGEIIDDNAFFEELEGALAGAMDMETLEEVWTEYDPLARFDGDDVNIGIVNAIKNRRVKQIEKADG